MNNSKETLDKISKIQGLEDEIIQEIIKDDLEEYNSEVEKKRFIEHLLGDISSLNEDKIISKLVEFYKSEPPYIGYCHKYWATKKDILKNKYNIEWYSPQEENPWIDYD